MQIFVFLATMLAGRVTFSTPMLFGVGGIAVFVIGGLTGVMVALAPFNWQAHDTYFIVAHLHYVLIGGMLFPVVAGIYYWYPLVGAKRLSDRLGRIAFWAMFAGFNLAFFPMHLAGLRGMPRRVFTYPEAAGWSLLNLLSSCGAAIFAAGVLLVVIDVLRPKAAPAALPGEPLGRRDPRMDHPPGGDLGRALGAAGREPLSDLGAARAPRRESAPARGTCPTPRRAAARRSSPRCSTPTPSRCCASPAPPGCRWPRPSRSAASSSRSPSTGGWSPAPSPSSSSCRRSPGSGPAPPRFPEKPEKAIGHGLSLPLYVSGERAVGWWGMFITMVGDATAFASLVFGYFFYWTIHPDLTAGHPGPGVAWPMAALGLFVAAWAAMLGARSLNGRGATAGMRAAVVVAFVLTLAAGAAGFAGPWTTGLDPTAHVYPAIVWVLVLWTLAHAGVALLMQLYCLARSLAGKLTPTYDADLRNVVLYTHFLTITALVTFLVVGLFPLAI